MSPVMSDYTHVNLMELEDQAPGFGLKGIEARFAREPLSCQKIGLSLQRLDPNTPGPFAHKHKESEEVYVVVAGSGVVWLDGEERPVGQWDAIRVAPDTARAFSAGPDGLQVIAFGTAVQGDAEMLPSPWAGD
jgi:mannose-6-phosphate isomerase-like protein (cupin superfamily)